MQKRNSALPHHTQDRGWWYLHGEELETSFVSLCHTRLGLDAQVNPEKERDF